jgi:hypothetical protein
MLKSDRKKINLKYAEKTREMVNQGKKIHTRFQKISEKFFKKKENLRKLRRRNFSQNKS